MTKQQAKKEAKNRVAAAKVTWCPLIKKFCNTSCVCYGFPRIYESDFPTKKEKEAKDTFGVRYGYCTAYMLHGPK